MGRKNSGHKSINKKNLKTAGIVVFLGAFLVSLLLIKDKEAATDSDVLIREENGKNQNIKLVAESEYGEEDIEIELLSRTYSDTEIENMKEDFLNNLKLKIRSGNESFEKIYDDLEFPEVLEGYPFALSYRVRPRGIVDSSGVIMNDIEEETPIELEITYSLDNFEEKDHNLGGSALDIDSDYAQYIKNNAHKAMLSPEEEERLMKMFSGIQSKIKDAQEKIKTEPHTKFQKDVIENISEFFLNSAKDDKK